MPSFSEVDDALGISFKGFIRGLWCALDIPRAIKPFVANRATLLGALKVAAANVILIAGSDAVVLNRWLRPSVRSWGDYLYADVPQILHPPQWVEPLCALLFYATWLVPIWGLIYAAVNIPTNNELAEALFEAAQIQQRKSTTSELTSTRRQRESTPQNSRTEEETYRNLFFLILLAQKYALLVVPEATRLIAVILLEQLATANGESGTALAMSLRAVARSFTALGVVAQAAAFVFSTLLSSLYAFDYAWSIEGVSVQRRHVAIEAAWPFFLGFGLPITILTFFLKPPFVSLGLYSAFFPWPLALAPHSTAAASKEVGLASQYALPPLPLFAPSRRLCDNLLDRVMAFVLGKKRAAVAQAQTRSTSASSPPAGAKPRSSTNSTGSTGDNGEAPNKTEKFAESPVSSEGLQERRSLEPPPHLRADLARGQEQVKAFAQARERMAKGITRATH